jgi:type IV secretion system protein TrbD
MGTDSHRLALRKVPIRRSLVRPMLFMGGERFLVVLSVLLCLYLAYVMTYGFGWKLGIPVPGALWACLIFLLRRFALKDPLMSSVFWRHRKYKSFYPARGRFSAPTPLIKD